MESIIKSIQSMIKKIDNDENKNKAIGGQIMLILLAETNIGTLKNPVKCFKKIVAKFVQKKELSHVLKYCRLVGLKPNANKDLVFIDGLGDNNAMKQFMEAVEKSGRSDDIFVLDFSKAKGGSIDPKTGEFTPINEA